MLRPWRAPGRRAAYPVYMDKEATASVSAGAQSGRAVLMLLLATLYWGVSFPVIKTLVEVCHRLLPEAGTWYLTAATVAPRFLLATLFMVLVRPRGAAWPTRSEVRQGLGIGIVAAIGTLLQTDGMQFTEASTSSFLTQFSAILIPVSLAVRNRRNPGAVVWLSCALVLAGVAILGHFNWRTFHFGRGEWETLLCSLFFSGQILWVGKKEFAGNRPDAVALVMFACQAAAFLGMALCTAPDARALGLPWLSWFTVCMTQLHMYKMPKGT